jgi:hypothetical protein
MKQPNTYVDLDVHKDKVAIASAEAGKRGVEGGPNPGHSTAAGCWLRARGSKGTLLHG